MYPFIEKTANTGTLIIDIIMKIFAIIFAVIVVIVSVTLLLGLVVSGMIQVYS